MQTYTYDIVIPSWNQSDLAMKCLESIKKYSQDYRVIFVDNGSDEGEIGKIKEVLKTMPHTLVRLNENLGFIRATNIGLSLVTAPYFVLMNNDTEAVEGWLDKFKSALVGTVIASGGLTTTPNSWQGKWKGCGNTIVLPKSAMLAFFCTMFKREVLDEIGILDEKFGVGLGDDDDYCQRIHAKGYDLALVENITIPHHHRSTFKKLYSQEQIERMQKEAMEKLKQ